MGLTSFGQVRIAEALWDLQAGSGLQSGTGLGKSPEANDTAVRKLRVLVVDDERLVADTLSEILKRFKYDAFPFYSGEAAIAAARELCPDFVLSDVIMPRLNGVETVLKIREICPHTRVILLSGNAATADLLTRAHSEGHDFELLAKPVHPDELLRYLH
jgi:CheY-like chemotaxis protein